MRITTKIIENKIERLNKLMDYPLTQWTREGDSLVSNIGHIFLDTDSIHQVSNNSGSCTHLYGGSKRDMDSFIDGMLQMYYINEKIKNS